MFAACNICRSQERVYKYECTLEDTAYGSEWMNLDTRKEGEAASGRFFSYTDRQHPYGLGLEIPVPSGLEHRIIQVAIRGMFRITAWPSNNTVVISVIQNDSTVFWQGRNVTEKFGQLNQWSSFYDSILLPRNITKGTRLKIYMWNQDGKSETSVDDLEIYLTEEHLPSFLPD